MIDPGKAVKQSAETSASNTLSVPKLVGAVIFGLFFGFLLQKGGVAKFDILIGQLLLRDWTVAKIMLTAILVGMMGFFTLHHFAKVNLHIRPTKLASNALGGLLFGAGFALIGYCPGTAAAALGQGSWDVLFGMAGLLVGSWVFVECSGWIKAKLDQVGDLGKVMLPDLVPLPRAVFIFAFAVVLLTALIVLEKFTNS